MNLEEFRRLPDADNVRYRCLSDDLTAFGFRPGAPLMRAKTGPSRAELEVNELWRPRARFALVPVGRFVTYTVVNQPPVCVKTHKVFPALKFWKRGIRESPRSDLFGVLFPEHSQFGWDHCVTVDGLITWRGDKRNYPLLPEGGASQWHLHDGIFPRACVLAIHDEDGAFVTAVVQRLPEMGTQLVFPPSP